MLVKQLVAFCDRHKYLEGKDVEAEVTLPSIIVQGIEYMVDLCLDCYVEWHRPYVEMVRAMGQRTDGDESNDMVPCELCPHQMKGPRGRTQHMRQAHNKVWTRLQEAGL